MREKKTWAIALHGGAGTIPRDLPEEKKAEVLRGLERALTRGKELLEGGASAVDVVEQVVMLLEDDPLFNAGKGAVFNEAGEHELDASLMRGKDLACGAVAGVKRVRHPIKAARQVMEKTRHVLLAGEGADRFAAEQGLELVENGFFSTPSRREQWQKARAQAGRSPVARPAGSDELDAGLGEGNDATDEGKKGTVGVVVLDRDGHLAAGTSTGGLTLKRWGRVGDSPVVGAGTYADDRAAAVSCTGTGEEFIRHAVAHGVVARVLWLDEPIQDAADHLVHRVLKKGDGGLISVDRFGTIAFAYNSEGMYRGAADSDGRFEVAIWE